LSNGGSNILTYHLQFAESFASGWTDVEGLESPSLRTIRTLSNLVKGQSYKFRYRVMNSIGWSDYSLETTAVAAQAPGKLRVPIYDSSSPTSIILDFDSTVDNGGDPITSYQLEMLDEQAVTPAFALIQTYVSAPTTQTLTDLSHGI